MFWVCFCQLLSFRQLLLAMRWDPGTGDGLHKSFSNRNETEIPKIRENKCSECVFVSYYHFASYCWQWGGTPTRAAAITQRWLSRNNWHLQIYLFLLLSPSWFTILHFHIVSVLLMYKRGLLGRGIASDKTCIVFDWLGYKMPGQILKYYLELSKVDRMIFQALSLSRIVGCCSFLAPLLKENWPYMIRNRGFKSIKNVVYIKKNVKII